jgi:hypothetical protein
MQGSGQTTTSRRASSLPPRFLHLWGWWPRKWRHAAASFVAELLWLDGWQSSPLVIPIGRLVVIVHGRIKVAVLMNGRWDVLLKLRR